MQGAALEALKAFLVTLLGLGSQNGGASFDQLLGSLLSAGGAHTTGKQAQVAVAQCIGALCGAAGPEPTMRTVTSLLGQLQGSNRSTEVRLRKRSACLGFHCGFQLALACSCQTCMLGGVAAVLSGHRQSCCML